MIHLNNKLTIKNIMMSLESRKMLPLNKSKRNIKNSRGHCILTKKQVMSKNSKNWMKPMRHFRILKRGESMISMDQKEVLQVTKKICWTCSLEEAEEAEAGLSVKNKWPKSKPPKNHSKSPYKIFITAELSNLNIQEQDAVKSVVVKVDNKFKNANNAKVRAWSYKCIKWDQECTNRFKNIAINAPVKVKSSLNPPSVNHAMAKRFHKRRKHFKSQLKRVLQIITP